MKPYGFDVGQSERGTVLKGLDIGVQGMRVGGQVRLISIIVYAFHGFAFDIQCNRLYIYTSMSSFMYCMRW